jgi:N4-gp56 family major capsid protein
LNKLYNKLSRKGNGAPTFGGLYVLMAHDDVINDIREDTAAGGWMDISKYNNAQQVFNNEVGTYKGFRVIRNNYLAGVDQGGAGTVDVYPIVAFGANALGKAVSKDATMVATGPFDKLARFANLGWHGVFTYGIVEQDNLWVGYVASSVGANAA